MVIALRTLATSRSASSELRREMITADAPALLYSSAPGRWVLAITVLARSEKPVWLDTPGVAWQKGPAMMVLPDSQAFHGLDVLSYVAEMTAAADRGGRHGR